jgi:hypothetical protein
MGSVARWLTAMAVALILAVGLGTADAPSMVAATAQEAWLYYENNGYGCLSRTWNGFVSGHVVCGGEVDDQWFYVGNDGSVWIWDGARWVTVYWVQTDGYRSYLSVYTGDDLAFRAQLMYYLDGSIGMVEVFPRDLRAMDQTTAATTTAAAFSGYWGSQMFSGLYNAPAVGPII